MRKTKMAGFDEETLLSRATDWARASELLGAQREQYCTVVSLGEWDVVSSYKEAYDKAKIEQRLTMDEFLNALNEYSEF